MGANKTQRTEAIQQAGKRIVIAGEVQNIIEQHNFDRLIEAGVIVRTIEALNRVSNPKTTVLANIMFEAQRKKNRLLNFEGAGPGKPTPEAAISTYESLKF